MLKQFLDNHNNSGGFCELNSKFNNLSIHSNILKIEFKRLYTHLTIQFYDEGLITGEDKSNINIDYLKELIKKNNYSDYENLLLNSCFGTLEFKNSVRISGYMYSIMEYYFNKYKDNILYIDTDSIYVTEIQDEDFIKSIGVPYEIHQINQIYFIAKKRLYIEIDGEIVKRGVSNKVWESTKDVYHNMEAIMKSNIRERKLKELGL